MAKVLILYPELFRSRTKFNRKVKNIVSQVGKFSMVCPSDPSGFVQDLFEKDERVTSISCNTEWQQDPEISHCIVFDDGEEFREERKWLESSAVEMRWIEIPLTRVVNIRLEPKYQRQKRSKNYEYIGRGSYWGNPYSMFEAGEDREEVIRKFAYDFERDLFPNKKKSEVFKLAGKRLGCFCKPELCHGDVLADFLNQYDDGR